MAAFQIGHYLTLWEAHLETRLRRSIRNGSSRPGRKLRYFLPCPLLGDADVIGVLQVEPELRACAEPVSQTPSSVSSSARISPGWIAERGITQTRFNGSPRF